jgi:arabinose-5-phosphate isomerase
MANLHFHYGVMGSSKSAKLIIEAKKRGNRLHISGIGKPAHIAGYAASVISSTGTPAYFLHGTEAVHGSCGQLVAGDIVIMISNSGETAEMKATVNAIKNNGCQIIGVSGKSESWLAKESAAFLFAGVKEEGGPLNRAPRMSIIAETFILQILSLYLQMDYNLDPKQYVKWHPGGSLGHLRENEK